MRVLRERLGPLVAMALCACQPTTPPDVSLVQTELDSVLAHHANLLIEEDLDAVMELYSATAIVRSNHVEPLRGREAIRSFIGGWFANVEFTQLEYHTEELAVFGDSALQIGSYEALVNVGGQVMPDKGNFFALWVRDADGLWRTHRSIFNSPLPLPGQPEEDAAGGNADAVPDREVPDPWFHAQRAIDLTGDGRSDAVTVRADGPSSDSLVITLSFSIGAEERWHTEWRSSYMLIDPPEFPNGETSRSAYVRQGLMRTLESVSVEPFDSTQYVMMAGSIDSTIVRQPPEQEISLSYGYETTLTLFWDPKRLVFRLLWGCC